MDIMGTYTVDEVMRAFSLDNTGLLAVAAFTFFLGYMEYIYSFRLVLREKLAPYPMWMHTFYLAHDFTGALVFYSLARHNDFFWFFAATSVALLIWNCFEIYNIYKGITLERQEIWGAYHTEPVTVPQAFLSTIGQILLFVAIVNLGRMYMADVSMLKWFSITNMVMAVAPGFLWARRKTRDGASLGLAIVILVATVNTFLPGINMWAQVSPYFHQPWYYAMGVVCIGFAVRNLVVLLKLPAKTRTEGAKRPIW